MFIIGRKCFTKHEYLKSSFSKSTDNDIGIILFLLKIIVCNPDSCDHSSLMFSLKSMKIKQIKRNI